MMIAKYNSFRNYSIESTMFTRRMIIAFFFILILSMILIANLYYLQIICFEDYNIRSNKNRIKIIPIIPKRGIIYDCNKIPLATNHTIYQLKLIPNKIKNLEQTIHTLRSIVDLTKDDINNFKKELKNPQQSYSFILKKNLTEVQQARLAVNRFRLPGVEIDSYQRRHYPYKSILTHVIGYVSKIDKYDLKYLNQKGLLINYTNNQNIGKLGIERYYEDILRGKMGYKKVEVNNYGHIIRKLYEQPPQAGKDIILTLDINLQKYIKELLLDNRAAVIVSDPRDGSIRALISNPSYDPNLFVDGISSKNYTNLLEDKNLPLINRSTQGVYPPASTVKPYISISALTTGIVNKNSLLFDSGWWQLPGSKKRYRDWKRLGHGQLNITKALEESADTFFYQVAYDMGIDRLSEWMSKFGYGQYTGIDIPEEYIGILPTREWKIKYFKKPWYKGDTIPVGIGQGYWTATPIQMLKALMILINDGTVYIPHLFKGIWENGQIISTYSTKREQIINLHSKFWKVVKDGMYGVANRSNGTAYKDFINTKYKVAAKSGTAQLYNLKSNDKYNIHKVNERLRDHKLMIAFAPYDKPNIAIVVILENGGINITVGTITRQIFDYVLLNNNVNNR